MLNSLNSSNKNLEDDQVSIVSHDTIFSNFKKDIRKDNIDDKDFVKIKPVISEKFIDQII